MATSRHFGSFSPTRDYVETAITQRGEQVRVNLNLADPATFVQSELDVVDRAIDDIDRYDTAARGAFAAVMNDDASEPAQFWRFHRDEVEGYATLEREAFVATLRLERVGFYPDGAFGAKANLVLDYVLRGPHSDQLLVAKFLRDESLRMIAWES